MKKVILVSSTPDTQEIEELIYSLDYQITEKFVQRIKKPNPKYFVGSGFVGNIREFIDEEDVDLVIFNHYLKAPQIYNLEKRLSKPIADRIRIILEVFLIRAASEEARLQVELATLNYEIPLVREWIHSAKKGEHPGFLAGGEYAVDQYYEMIRKRIKKIKVKLERIRAERALRRTRRKRLGFYTVSIIGYTNAGKSTLLNKLTDKQVIINEKMFSTISTLTGRIPKQGLRILLTDTVGFIEDLPPWLIESFKSTLEEITHSDIILLVVDVSNDVDEITRKINTCYKILSEMEYQPPVIIVLNKIDKMGATQFDNTLEKLREAKIISSYVAISAQDGLNLERLRAEVYNELPDQMPLELILPKNDFSSPFINWLYENTLIIKNEQLSKNRIYLKMYSPASELDYIKDQCKELDAKIFENK
ncbi:MAG: GTPase HflX [Thermoplasmata archaeon]|nr:GTPase HflX [Thermoplasmata archaeon]